jgi:hypothetical protein
MVTVLTRAMAMLGVAMVLATGCDAEDGTSTIGREGGVVTSPDGRVTLEIPAGALSQDVEVSIGELDTQMPEDALGFAYEIEPAGLQLSRPATITFDLSAGEAEARELDLSDAELAVEDLAVMTDKGDVWDRLADRETDPELQTVSGSVLFFGAYAVAPR